MSAKTTKVAGSHNSSTRPKGSWGSYKEVVVVSTNELHEKGIYSVVSGICASDSGPTEES